MKTRTILLLSSLFIAQASFGQTDLNKQELQVKDNTITDTKGEKIFNAILSGFKYGADSVLQHFDKNAIIEFPYAPSLGTAERLYNREYYNYLKGALPNMPNIQFTNIKVYPTSKNGYWAEAHGEAIIPSTGNLYKQKYVMYFVLTNGKVSLYREYWDPIAGQIAFGQATDLKDIFNKRNKSK